MAGKAKSPKKAPAPAPAKDQDNGDQDGQSSQPEDDHLEMGSAPAEGAPAGLRGRPYRAGRRVR